MKNWKWFDVARSVASGNRKRDVRKEELLIPRESLITLGKRFFKLLAYQYIDREGLFESRVEFTVIPVIFRRFDVSCPTLSNVYTDWGGGPSTFPPLTSRILSPSKTSFEVINARAMHEIESPDFEILPTYPSKKHGTTHCIR